MTSSRFSAAIVVTSITVLVASAASAEIGLRHADVPVDERLAVELKLRAPIADALAKAEETCMPHTISCGETVTSTLTTEDCPLGDGTFFDQWTFDGSLDDQVTIDLASDAFDTFAFLLDPALDVATTDDDSGAGSNSQIIFPLYQSGVWSILANNFNVVSGDPGEYTLTLQCESTTPTGPPAAPSDLQAAPQTPTEVLLGWTDNSDNESGFPVEVSGPGFDFTEIGVAPANAEGAVITGLDPGTPYQFRIRARNSAGDSEYSNVAEATTPSGDGECFPSLTTLCLQGGRFAVETEWMTPSGQSGVGLGGNINDETGAFFFFSPSNVEVVIKVLDACEPPFSRFWVFAGGLTNVETIIRVTDTATDETRTYSNPQGEPFRPIQDTDAFATCP